MFKRTIVIIEGSSSSRVTLVVKLLRFLTVRPVSKIVGRKHVYMYLDLRVIQNGSPGDPHQIRRYGSLPRAIFAPLVLSVYTTRVSWDMAYIPWDKWYICHISLLPRAILTDILHIDWVDIVRQVCTLFILYMGVKARWKKREPYSSKKFAKFAIIETINIMAR